MKFMKFHHALVERMPPRCPRSLAAHKTCRCRKGNHNGSHLPKNYQLGPVVWTLEVPAAVQVSMPQWAHVKRLPCGPKPWSFWRHGRVVSWSQRGAIKLADRGDIPTGRTRGSSKWRKIWVLSCKVHQSVIFFIIIFASKHMSYTWAELLDFHMFGRPYARCRRPTLHLMFWRSVPLWAQWHKEGDRNLGRVWSEPPDSLLLGECYCICMVYGWGLTKLWSPYIE